MRSRCSSRVRDRHSCLPMCQLFCRKTSPIHIRDHERQMQKAGVYQTICLMQAACKPYFWKSVSRFEFLSCEDCIADCKSAIPGSNPGGASPLYLGATRRSLVLIGADRTTPLRT